MLDWLSALWNSFSSVLISMLPTSPFADYIYKFSNLPYLSWLNWFIPFDDFIKIGGAYLIAVGLFYVYMIVARWLKVIGD